MGNLLTLLFTGLLLHSVSAVVLEDFQVAQPPPVPRDAKQCTLQILQRDFAFSFGSAEVVTFSPPTDCGLPGSWSGITLNLTVTSNGTQFDRLGIFTFQNVEIWRTSTPEPSRGDGIIWTYIKDVTRYIPLFAKPGTFILQLDNLIQPGLDGIYSTTVHATFYASSAAHPPAKKADLIIPLSTFANNTGDDASVPPSFSLNVTLPQNSVGIYAELYASGNGNEEFWYFNAPNQFLPDLPPGITFGQGPFRELRVLVEDQLAGVAFPYATIFTGGIIPTVWRPITSYGALDLPTYFLDLSPFIPVLVDGKPHKITLDMSSAEDDHTVLQNWFVSGLLQVITDSSQKRTIGSIKSYSADPFAQTSASVSTGANGDVNFTVTATHKIHIESEYLSGSGKSTHVTWTQDLQYSNIQNYLKNGSVQNVFQHAQGNCVSLHNDIVAVADSFSYPLNINITLLSSNGSSFNAAFDHSYNRDLLPSPLITGSKISENQISSGFFNISPAGNTGNGTNANTFEYIDADGNTYGRKVTALLNNITFDVQSGNLAPVTVRQSTSVDQGLFEGSHARLPGGRVVS
ncbi:peptide N-acetyl-beta-D-glucosaminyl asparaginase amidase A-domain-containing protein [Collybia nuda]|uniref:Peptide N-acetyl-beta-D-glucosaminyl asparaginase amidase A-domain-containing protein n=1 Tax=Collybia nuda TaxID=64659 RepID=A0A9P6CG53_9AGAR|nr:peptide N-acetyl-beta-D-glucosaminyl asparaginase amidase A-domain-containing protein [Collybia nuda]